MINTEFQCATQADALAEMEKLNAMGAQLTASSEGLVTGLCSLEVIKAEDMAHWAMLDLPTQQEVLSDGCDHQTRKDWKTFKEYADVHYNGADYSIEVETDVDGTFAKYAEEYAFPK